MNGLNNKYIFLTVLEPGKFEIRVPADLVAGEVPLSALQTAKFSLCPHMAQNKEKGCTFSDVSSSDTNSINEGSTCMTVYVPKAHLQIPSQW